jgi:hypothetical protein
MMNNREIYEPHEELHGFAQCPKDANPSCYCASPRTSMRPNAMQAFHLLPEQLGSLYACSVYFAVNNTKQR